MEKDGETGNCQGVAACFERENIMRKSSEGKALRDSIAKYRPIWDNKEQLCQEFFANLKRSLPALKEKLKTYSSHWGFEDPIYRFYHRSYKAYGLQSATQDIVSLLMSLCPKKCFMNEQFEAIFHEGTSSGEFELSHNAEWDKRTRPMVEAFFHARFFLEMAVKYGEELEEFPSLLPSGFAALLYLYNLR